MAMNFGSYIGPTNNNNDMPFMNFGGQTQQAPIHSIAVITAVVERARKKGVIFHG